MAGMFELFESGLLRGNRTGGAAFDVPTTPAPEPTATPRPTTASIPPAAGAEDAAVRRQILAERARQLGVGTQGGAAAPRPAVSGPGIGAEAGKAAAKGLGARMLGLATGVVPAAIGAVVMSEDTPFPKIKAKVESGLNAVGEMLPDFVTGRATPPPSGVAGAPRVPLAPMPVDVRGRGANIMPVTQAELDMGERNYQVAVGGGAGTQASALDPRIKIDAQGNIVRSGPTLDANGNIVIDTARVGQVAAEEKAIMARAFPKAVSAAGARGVQTVTEDGMPTFGGNFADFPRFSQELGDYAATVGAQRTGARTQREVLKERAKAAEQGKPFTVEGLTGKTVVQGDKAYSLDEKGNLVVKKVPATAQTFGPGLDPAMVRKEAEAAVKAGKSKAAINQALKDNGYNFQVK